VSEVEEKIMEARRRATKDKTKIIIFKNSQLSKINTYGHKRLQHVQKIQS